MRCWVGRVVVVDKKVVLRFGFRRGCGRVGREENLCGNGNKGLEPVLGLSMELLRSRITLRYIQENTGIEIDWEGHRQSKSAQRSRDLKMLGSSLFEAVKTRGLQLT